MQEFEKGKVYIVTHKTWNNDKTVTAKRKFLFTEKRFKTIPCYVFSSRITKKGFSSELSIPHYDLLQVKPCL